MPARERRLPRHLAWPLTATDVRACLGPLMAQVTELRFLAGPGAGTLVLRAEWIAPDPFNHGRGTHPETVGFRIDVLPVEAAGRAAARAVLQARALPQLHAWVTEALAADETWRTARHHHCWRLDGGRLTHRDEP
ncbi:hypothetical protein OG552_24660 [Streptomyces sp. NBC_01476]|uniref:hypothetical protein n=1 Tax=Streptomyces sp. NBC_01476 TaxID=2903881 RepID=UPI002E35588F|nr:hypothetical protein [Streptomyces sp. NBC_01476]